MNSIIPVSVLAALLLCSCSSDQTENAKPWELQNNNMVNNTTGGTQNNTTVPCAGDSFECTPGCGGDWFMGSECVNGQWRCPSDDGPWVPVDSCPPGSCFGLPLPGEICDDGFQCRPDITGALDACAEQMCLTCAGFDPVLHDTPECECTCTEGEVRCQRSTPTCEVTNSSTLAGVEIRLRGDDCAWTTAELAAGVTIAYEVIVDPSAATQPITSRPQDGGGCSAPGPSGLIDFFEIRSELGDQYCLCDTGLCFPNMLETALVPGTHPGDFDWFGANWTGPSDFGNPMGAPFAASAATVTVSAVGTTAEGQDFVVASRMTVTIEP